MVREKSVRVGGVRMTKSQDQNPRYLFLCDVCIQILTEPFMSKTSSK